MRAMKSCTCKSVPVFLGGEDRRSISRWLDLDRRYGCLLAGFIAYLALDQHRAADYAAVDPATAMQGSLVPPK